MENKSSKYFKYAIGEIVLVVIGILIAISINNWNENNKLEASETVYINKLYNDVLSMVETYRNDNEFLIRLDEAQLALKYLESCGNLAKNKKSFEETLLSHQMMWMYRENRSAYNEMVSNGAFSRLTNLKLKQAITALYSSLDFGAAQITYFRDEVGRASGIINNFVLFSYDDSGKPTVEYLINELCNNTPFRNAMVEIIDARQDWLVGKKNITDQLIELEALLKLE